ncbi:HD domain-containing protein [Shigella flexneri]
MLVILTACYFHDIVSLAKIIHNGSVRKSWRQKRRVACSVKSSCNFRQKTEAVCRAIAAHSFSAQIAPLTTEAKIVQDAERLEALGAIRLARVFAVSGASGVALFDGEAHAELAGESEGVDRKVIDAFSPAG